MSDSGRKEQPGKTPAAVTQPIGKRPSGRIPNPLTRPGASTTTAPSTSAKIVTSLPTSKPPSTSGYYGTVRAPAATSGIHTARPTAPKGVNSGVYQKAGNASGVRQITGGGVNSGVYSKAGNATGPARGVNAGVYAKSGNAAGPPRPAGTAARVPQRPGAPSPRSSSMMAVNCSRCGKVLSGSALADGRLVCPECIELERAKEARQRRTVNVAAAAVAVVLAGTAVILPQQAMFVLLLAGLGLIALGMISAGWARVARLGLISAGLAALGGGAWGLSALQGHAAAESAQALLETEAANVQKLLQDDDLLNARRELDALSNRVHEHPERYDAAQATARLKGLQGDIEKWFESRYPGLPPEGQSVLQGLMRSFPDQPAAGGQGKIRRVHALKVDNKEAVLKFVSSFEAASAEKGAPPNSDPRVAEARAVVLYLFDSLPYLSQVKVDFGTMNGSEFKAFGGVSVSRDVAGSLRLGNVPPGFFNSR